MIQTQQQVDLSHCKTMTTTMDLVTITNVELPLDQKGISKSADPAPKAF